MKMKNDRRWGMIGKKQRARVQKRCEVRREMERKGKQRDKGCRWVSGWQWWRGVRWRGTEGGSHILSAQWQLVA